MSHQASPPEGAGPAHPASAPGPAAFHAVLHEPEIPNNTGNAGRTCVALGAALHLVHPLGFDLSEKAVRRAGLDYWPRLDLREHADWPAYRAAAAGARVWMLSTRGERLVYEAELRPEDHFVFGGESRGLPEAVLNSAPPGRVLRLPMRPGERSLNLATSVAVVLYEAWRQVWARGGDVPGAARRSAGGG